MHKFECLSDKSAKPYNSSAQTLLAETRQKTKQNQMHQPEPNRSVLTSAHKTHNVKKNLTIMSTERPFENQIYEVVSKKYDIFAS